MYRRVLEDSKQSYPKDFWNSNVEQKAERLMRENADRNNISPSQIPYRDIPELVEQAKLQKPVDKAYLGNPYLLVLDSFNDVTPDDLRWNIRPEPTPSEIEALRNQYFCIWSSISNYYGTKRRKLKRITGRENTKISEIAIDAPVLETLRFWLEVKRIKDGKSTYANLFDEMEAIGWQKHRTDKYLTRYGVKKQIGRFKTAKKVQESMDQHEGRIYPTEQLAAEKLGKQNIQKLKGYGADFPNTETQTIIEVKRKLAKINITDAITQLQYAEEHLGRSKGKAIYTKNFDFPENQ